MLRELHEALRGQLAQTFPTAEVRKHAGEVDIETIQRHAMKRTNLWVTVAAGEGVDDSSDTELRMSVEWAVFVIAGSGFIDVDGEKRRLEPVEVAESIASAVLRLAYDNNWGIEACSRARRTDLRFVNLGVGLKKTIQGLDRSDVGLFVVWGRQELEIGENILPGHIELPPFGGFDGELEGQGPGGQHPSADVHESLGDVVVASLRSTVVSLVPFINRFRGKRAA